jgi:hypothetical protein
MMTAEGTLASDRECYAYAGDCANGALVVEQANRDQDDHCGSCDSGYELVNKVCIAYDGTCAHGALAVQASRTQHNHCGSCDKGFELSGASCTACGAGTFKADVGGHACTASTVCVSGSQYEKQDETTSSNRICLSHKECEDHQYESKAPGALFDRECATKQCTCSNGSGSSGSSCPAHNTEHCEQCNSGHFLKNTLCAMHKECTSTEYITSVGTSVADRECTAHTKCTRTQIETTVPNLTTNRGCTECAAIANCARDNSVSINVFMSLTRAQYQCAKDEALRIATASLVGIDVAAVTTEVTEVSSGLKITITAVITDAALAMECSSIFGSPDFHARLVAATNLALAQLESSLQCTDTDADMQVSECDQGQYVTTPQQLVGGVMVPAVCASWKECGAKEFETVEPDAKTNRECQAHRECTDLEHQTVPAGTKNDRECQTTTICQPGFYVAVTRTATRNRSCLPCGRIVGHITTFSTVTNAAACVGHTRCEKGSYVSKAAQPDADRECELCAAGTFSDYRDAPECTACEHEMTHRYQSQSGQSECVSHQPCDPGHQLLGYSDTSAGTCTACPAGKYKSSYGDAFATCSICLRGHFSASGAITCTRCQKGRYQGAFTQSSCHECPEGTFNPNEARTDVSHCEVCPSGKFADSTGTADCKACTAGFFGDAQLANTHANHCVACPAGQFQEYDGQTGCEHCASGTYSPTTGHGACLSCDVENGVYTGGKIDDVTFYWTENKAGWTKCEKHPRDCKYPDWVGNWKTCSHSCGGGDQIEERVPLWSEWGGGTPCTDFAKERTQTCNNHECPVDCVWSSWTSYDTCTRSCGTGTWTRTRSHDVTVKNGGVPCTGPFSESPSCNTHNCPEDCEYGQWGSFSHDGGVDGVTSGPTCTATCNGGRQTRTRSMKGALHGGKICVNGSEEQACNEQCCEGYFHNNNNSNACEQCPAGSYASQEGSPVCTTCESGRYQPSEAQTACIGCPKGTSAEGTGSTDVTAHCIQCARGRFADAEGSSGCKACDIGTFNDNEGGSSSAHCKNCVEGKFAADTASHACEECLAGQYNEEGATTASASCKLCAAGRYNTFKGMGTEGYCYFCKCGHWGIEGANVCSECPTGKYRGCPNGAADCDGGTSLESCVDAAPGHIAQQGSCSQTACSAGSYQASAGSNFCSSCPAGTFSGATGATSIATCQACPGGKWSSSNSETCTSCAAGKHRVAERAVHEDNCIDCAAGSYSSSDAAKACTECEAGRYQSTAGLTSCIGCGSGTFVASLGSDAATDCEDCAKGKFQPDDGKADCSTCAKGTYQDTKGQDTCIDCLAGKYNMFEGSSVAAACMLCATGQYSITNKAVSCTKCAMGKANGVKGATRASQCVYCAAGQFSDEEGLETCKRCASGKFGTANQGATDGLVHCLKCAKGKFQKYDGATTCATCPADTYTPPHSAGHDMVECIACKVIDSVRRYSTFGKAGEDHCEPVPVDCSPSQWGAIASWSNAMHSALPHPSNPHNEWAENSWSQCTKSCGTGRHTRSRHPLRMPAEPAPCGLSDPAQCKEAWGGGKACSHPDFEWSQTDDCNEHDCPIDCVETMWGHWEPCTKTCDSGSGAGGTYRVRKELSPAQFGGKPCGAFREPLVGLKPCNTHTCEHGASCGAEHVRCDVLMLEHHKSNFGIRKDLSTCAHSAIEEQNVCWNNLSCKTCKGSDKANSNVDHCNKEACHDADSDSERALHKRLEDDYAACTAGTDGNDVANVHREQLSLPQRQCRKLFPTLQVTHDRKHMAVLTNFKCAKTSATTCACKCDKHPACCAKKNQLLSNDMLFGNRFDDVDSLQDCCNMCTNHPSCGAWEYTTERICVLKSGSPVYVANPYPGEVTSWSGTPSGVGTC